MPFVAPENWLVAVRSGNLIPPSVSPAAHFIYNRSTPITARIGRCVSFWSAHEYARTVDDVCFPSFSCPCFSWGLRVRGCARLSCTGIVDAGPLGERERPILGQSGVSRGEGRGMGSGRSIAIGAGNASLGYPVTKQGSTRATRPSRHVGLSPLKMVQPKPSLFGCSRAWTRYVRAARRNQNRKRIPCRTARGIYCRSRTVWTITVLYSGCDLPLSFIVGV